MSSPTSTNTTEYTVFFTVQHGFLRRALAKLRTVVSVRDVREVANRLICAKVSAASVSQLDALTESSSMLRNTNMFVRMWLALAACPAPSPIAELARTRPRDESTPERFLLLSHDDVRPLLPSKE
jgi:hypothetical protein